MSWTPELKQEVCSLWVDHSASEIAEVMGSRHGRRFTRSQIIGVLHRAKLNSSAKTKAHRRDNYSQVKLRDEARIRQPAKPRAKRETIRIVPANGNSNAMRVVRSVVFDEPEPMQCEVLPFEVTINELDTEHCRYMVGEATYCGRQMFKRSFCVQHFARCYTEPQKRWAV